VFNIDRKVEFLISFVLSIAIIAMGIEYVHLTIEHGFFFSTSAYVSGIVVAVIVNMYINKKNT